MWAKHEQVERVWMGHVGQRGQVGLKHLSPSCMSLEIEIVLLASPRELTEKTGVGWDIGRVGKSSVRAVGFSHVC